MGAEDGGAGQPVASGGAVACPGRGMYRYPWPSGQTWAVGVSVPPAVERLLTADVAQEIAKTFGDSPVNPERVVVDSPASHSRRFPGWPGPILALSDENQGVCLWGVPLDGSSGQVLVGGDLLDTGRATVTYTASVEDFIACTAPKCRDSV